MGEGPASLVVRLTGGEAVEDGRERMVCGGLEVLEGLAGGFGLLGVVLRFVPAGGDDRGPDKGGEGAAVGAGGGVDDVTSCYAQGAGGLVFGADLGALGACERCGGRS
ncbi:hypothetical protein ACJ6WF_19100 [Streptomyces sp. MMS24-I2-30]|uniref:hypothetical protein n=1 Tax=Streptomyces sp. MMS24-I2-30 TaxID=3351564 RepID=UPI003896BA9E